MNTWWAKSLLGAFLLSVTGLTGSIAVYAGLQYGDSRWVTIASTERALLRQYRLEALDLNYLEDKGTITEREQLKLDRIEIDIKEIEEELERW